MGLEKLIRSLDLDSVRIGELGSAVLFDSDIGDECDIDGLAIKTYLDHDSANRVRAARLRSGITQSDLGKRAGMDQAVISKMEHGLHRPRIDTLRRIADAL